MTPICSKNEFPVRQDTEMSAGESIQVSFCQIIEIIVISLTMNQGYKISYLIFVVCDETEKVYLRCIYVASLGSSG